MLVRKEVGAPEVRGKDSFNKAGVSLTWPNGKAHRRGRTEQTLRAASTLVAWVVVEHRRHRGLVRVQRDVSRDATFGVTVGQPLAVDGRRRMKFETESPNHFQDRRELRISVR